MSKMLHVVYLGVNLHLTYHVLETTAYPPKVQAQTFAVVDRVTTDYGVDLTWMLMHMQDKDGMVMLALAHLCEEAEDKLKLNAQA